MTPDGCQSWHLSSVPDDNLQQGKHCWHSLPAQVCLHRSPTCDTADGIWLVKVAGFAGLAGVLGVMGPSLSSSLLLPPCSGCTCTGEGRSERRPADTGHM